MRKNYFYAVVTVFIWATMAATTKKMLFDIPNLEALSISSYFAFLFLLLMNLKNGALLKMREYSAKDYGLFSVLNKKADYDQNICMMVIWLVTAVSAMILGLLTEQWVMITGVRWFGILWLGVVIDAVAYLLWALALNGTKNTAKIVNLAFLTPFLSLVVSAVLLKETIQIRAFVALVFIIGGILLQNLCEYLCGKLRG